MQRGWELEIGGSRPRTEMVRGDFWSRLRPYMGCSAREGVSECFALQHILHILSVGRFMMFFDDNMY